MNNDTKYMLGSFAFYTTMAVGVGAIFGAVHLGEKQNEAIEAKVTSTTSQADRHTVLDAAKNSNISCTSLRADIQESCKDAKAEGAKSIFSYTPR